MNVRADHFTPLRWPGWATSLRSELAYTPGRDLATARIVLTVALVTVISMTLQVPEAATSAYMVIFVTKENRVVTTLAGVLTILAITTGIIVSFLIYRYTFDYPVLRIPGLAVALFAGMFLSRVFVIGPLGFGIGFVVALTQSASDGIPDAELLVRALLWIWVALVYPIALCVAVNQSLFPAEPWIAFTRALDRRLDFAVAALRRAADDGKIGGSQDPELLAITTGNSAPLLKLLRFAEARNPELKKRHLSLVAAVTASEQVASAAAGLALGEPQTLTENDQLCARALEVQIAALQSALAKLEPVPDGFDSVGLPADSPGLRDLQLTVSTLADSLTQERAMDKAGGFDEYRPKKSLLVSDAFTNPAHVHFALKVTLASMSCYVLYAGLDWPGIHTSLITCCIIALESAGATRRKGWLRLAGCCIGGSLGFLSITYLVPQMESVVSLVLLVSAVTALAGWIATGSERIAYGGLQIALAFYLGIFQDYAPGTDFEKIRDRLMGIILGITVSSVFFRYIWPERAGDKLHAVVERVLRALAEFVRVPQPGVSPTTTATEINRLRSGIANDLDLAVTLAELSVLEKHAFDASDHLSPLFLSVMVRRAQSVFLVSDLLTTAPQLEKWGHLSIPAQNAEATLRDAAATQLSRMTDLVHANPPQLSNVESNDIAAIDPSELEKTAAHRWYLLRRLTEKIHQLVGHKLAAAHTTATNTHRSDSHTCP